MPSKKNKTPILPGKVYHIYNRGNNFEKTFFIRNDYLEFLNSYKKYLGKTVDTYAFALITNHFHFLIRIKENSHPGIFSKQYSKWILHYSNLINYREQRSGSLFLNPFKRVEVNTEEYLKRIIFYIHFNPQKHKLTDNFKDSIFTSYQSYISDHITELKREYIFDIFGSKDEFIEYHQYFHDEIKIKNIMIED